jgi:vacuolar-type H+-ATPase subunit H
MDTTTKQIPDGTGIIFDNYKISLTEAIEKELQRLRMDAENEAAKIISEAEQHAQQIVDQAEEKAKQEAKEKTKQEISSIIAIADKESKTILSEAEQNALKQANQIISEARLEALKQAKVLTENVTRKAQDLEKSAFELKQKAEQQSVEITNRANLEAEEIVKEAVDGARVKVSPEENRILSETRQVSESIINQSAVRVKNTMEEATSSLRLALDKLNRQAEEISGRSFVNRTDELKSNSVRINDLLGILLPELKPDRESGDTLSQDSALDSVLTQETLVSVDQLLNSEANNNSDQDSTLYYGQIELHIVTPAEGEQLNQFQEQLKSISKISIVQSINSTADGIAIIITVDMAIPLFDIIRKLPSVKEAENVGKDILITLSRSKKKRKK